MTDQEVRENLFRRLVEAVAIECCGDEVAVCGFALQYVEDELEKRHEKRKEATKEADIPSDGGGSVSDTEIALPSLLERSKDKRQKPAAPILDKQGAKEGRGLGRHLREFEEAQGVGGGVQGRTGAGGKG